MEQPAFSDPIKSGDYLTITSEEFSEMEKYELLAFEGNGKQILDYIHNLYPASKENDELKTYADFVPAWVTEHPTEGEKIILNTDLVKDQDIQKVFRRHESIEIIMSKRNLNSTETAKNIGVDSEVIVNDLYNTPAHYVALYYQVKLAQELGVTDKMFREMKNSISIFLKEHVLPSTKKEAEAYNEPWQQCFKYITHELVRLNISTLRQIIKYVSAQ